MQADGDRCRPLLLKPPWTLSVNQRNQAAISVYQRLGFLQHCRFVEGVATLA